MSDFLGLTRIPPDPKLRAWNAADEIFLSRHASELKTPVLIVNDAFGALACNLANYQSDWLNDSAMSLAALQVNSLAKGFPVPNVIERPEKAYGAIIMQLPKSVRFMAWQLQEIFQCTPNDTPVFFLGMVKHISKGHIDLINQSFSKVDPGLSEKKARVIRVSGYIGHQNEAASHYSVSEERLALTTLPGCYAEHSADPGSRVFLQFFDELPKAKKAIDLGCGNGLLSLAYRRRHPETPLLCIDESRQAIQSARINFQNSQLDMNQIQFIHNDGLNGLSVEGVDLVLCNPPFHQHHIVTERIAESLITQAAQALSKGGQAWWVANRHLEYLPMLSKQFSSVTIRSKHPKFIVYQCLR